MEDSLFEYSHKADEEFVKKVYRFTCFRLPYLIVRFFIGFVLAAALIAVAVRLTIIGDKSYALIFRALAAVEVALTVLLPIFEYRRAVSINMKRRREISGKSADQVENASVTESEIRFSGPVSEYSVQFASIKRVYVTSDLIILRSGSKQLFPFSKDGFTKGAPEGFVDFLHGKGIK